MKKALTQFTSAKPNPNLAIVQDITVDELSQKLEAAHLIDVRRSDEYTGELGHIKGTKLLTLDTLPEHLESLPKDEPIVFVCRSGGRSAQATAFALQNGFQHVFNMQGGMLKWNELGLPIEK
jgi:rhodanese-related sulfurtransferase